MDKTVNQKAWFLVLPVLVLVAFSAVIPLMTVVNYAFNDTFGQNEFFWAGIDWFEEMVTSDRLHEAVAPLLGDRLITGEAVVVSPDGVTLADLDSEREYLQEVDRTLVLRVT